MELWSARSRHRSKGPEIRKGAPEHPLGSRGALTSFPFKLKLPILLLLIVTGGLSACGGGGGGGTNPAFTGDCAKLPYASAPDFNDRLTKFVEKSCYKKQQWKHDQNIRTSDGVHFPFIQIFYSPSLFKWMTKDKRQGPPPDGALVIKEEHQTETSPVQFRSVMFRDSTLWWDGWFWAVIGVEAASSASPSLGAGSGCAEAQFP